MGHFHGGLKCRSDTFYQVLMDSPRHRTLRCQAHGIGQRLCLANVTIGHCRKGHHARNKQESKKERPQAKADSQHSLLSVQAVAHASQIEARLEKQLANSMRLTLVTLQGARLCAGPIGRMREFFDPFFGSVRELQ